MVHFAKDAPPPGRRRAAGGVGVPVAPARRVRAGRMSGRSRRTSRNGPVRLHRNENAYGPSPRAIAAIQESVADVANRYPDVEGSI